VSNWHMDVTSAKLLDLAEQFQARRLGHSMSIERQAFGSVLDVWLSTCRAPFGSLAVARLAGGERARRIRHATCPAGVARVRLGTGTCPVSRDFSRSTIAPGALGR
jgi:hypothetical protein